MEVFTTLNQDTITPIQSENYKHEFGPACLAPPAPFDRSTFAAHLKEISRIMRSFPVRSKETWVNPSLNQVIIWADSETFFHDHVKDNNNHEEWRYEGEYFWVLTMDSTGEKVERVIEFVDSKSTERLLALMARAFKKEKELRGTSAEEVKGGWKYEKEL